MTRLALIIPSYARANDLATCLHAATNQTDPFDEIIVALRAGDEPSVRVASEFGVRVATVSEPGVLAAMIAGVQASTCELVAFTDDDAVVPPTHAGRLRRAFADSTIGGVGGRDCLFDGDVPRPTALQSEVGRITRYGRVIGNHHCGTGAPRPVAMLKGVNSAYRRSLLALPTGLRGQGAQAHFEIAVGQWVRQQGATLLYDPSLTVEHHPATRLGDDQREAPNETALFDSAYNLTRSLPQRLQSRRVLYVLLVGDANCPGLIRLGVAAIRREGSVLLRRRSSWAGTLAAWRDRHQPLAMHRFSE